ncbi:MULTISPECIES: RNA polymerase sigma factor [unclassified Isoptericola]|uniref:RNA polymerase sigma factor n=1 Tax=unclassified Isoptericola TaxID=2623355 RepID=UPI00365D5A21
MRHETRDDMTAVARREPASGDAAIISASIEEPEHFAALYGRYSAQLYRYAYRRVGAEHAEDVVADTFVAAFRRRDSYDLSRIDARPWLFGIATKEIARWHRAEAARYRAFARSGVAPADDDLADGVAAAVSARAAGPALTEALASLAARDRDVLLLAAWGDLTYEQIARTLEIKIGTVRSRLHRARRVLRARLRAQGWTEES